jgi:hypothetical protein
MIQVYETSYIRIYMCVYIKLYIILIYKCINIYLKIFIKEFAKIIDAITQYLLLYKINIILPFIQVTFHPLDLY